MTLAFSVILSTWNRGSLILPTLQSALRQEFDDFEVLIVGDGCTDDTDSVVAPFLSDRVRWMNLPSRGGSQSFANNAGLAAARGRHIAYLGHDDIWAPDHLRTLYALFQNDPGLDFAVGGSICHMAPGFDLCVAMGLFENDDRPMTYFSPPSSFGHRFEAVQRLGGWRLPTEVSDPVDHDLLKRAVAAGMRFASTGRVSVHKFAAGHRYLYYLRQDASEQEAMLQRMQQPDFEQQVQRWLDAARRDGEFMSHRLVDFSAQGKGTEFVRASKAKASRAVPPVELTAACRIEQDDGYRIFDWHPLSPAQPGWRWSGPNPRPRTLIPYAGTAPCRVSIRLLHSDRDVLRQVAFSFNGQQILPAFMAFQHGEVGWTAEACFVASLRDTASLLELIQPSAALSGTGRNQRGVAVGSIFLEPLKSIDEEQLALDGARTQGAALVSSQGQIAALLSSRSWRLTEPLRRVRRWFG